MLALPLVGGIAVLALPAAQVRRPWVGARATSLVFGIATLIVAGLAGGRVDYGGGGLQLSVRLWKMWVGVDGLSMPLVLLTAGMGLIAMWGSYGVKKGVKGYFALLQFWMAFVLGTLTAMDGMEECGCLLAAVVVLYLLVAGWGSDRCVTAARRFIYFALPAMVGVMVALWARLGRGALLGGAELATYQAGAHGAWGFWVIVAGLGVVAAVLPVHWWLADVVAEATTPVAMLAVGVMQTLGSYGMMRMSAFFAAETATHRMFLGLVGTVTLAYGALAAVGQKNLKRMAAYVSVSLMGYVWLGLAMATPAAGMGAAYLLCGHAIAAGMLVFVAGMIEDRVGHCEIGRLGGVNGHLPAFGGWAAVGILAAVGLPGLSVFAGELLVVLGAFERSSGGAGAGVEQGFVWMGVVGVGVMAMLLGCGVWTYQRVFTGGTRPEHANLARMSVSERWILGVMGVSAVVLGIVPGVVTEAVGGWVGR